MKTVKGRYTSDVKIYTDNIEEGALSMVQDIADSPYFEGKRIRIMPDVHIGKGIVIGFSCPINPDTDYINPAHIGCDIGCTISATFFDSPIPSDKIPLFEEKIRDRVLFGMNIHDMPLVDIDTVISRFNRIQTIACEAYPSLNPYRIYFRDEQDIQRWGAERKIGYSVLLKSLGTVGSGNHFVEYDVFEDKDNPTNNKYTITVHCGSRNLGQRIFNFWEHIANSSNLTKKDKNDIIQRVKNENTDRSLLGEEIQTALKEAADKQAKGHLHGQEVYQYLIDMLLAQEYAQLNHDTIHKVIEDIYREIVPDVSVNDRITTTHNYIDFDLSHDGANMMIRKGAIRAYSDEIVIIPFNMRDGIAICRGKSNPDWNYTAPHGAGRVMSRKKAYDTLSGDILKEEMEEAGIYTTTAGDNTVDEAPEAYKAMKEIIENIEPTVDILYFMGPKMNIKSAES